MTDTRAYDYELPSELIAQQPLQNRADSRLLVVDRRQQSLDHFYVRDLPEILRADDLLVLNNSRVVPARLVGHRTITGGRWQGLFLESDPQGMWRILGKTRGRIQPGETVTLEDRHGHPKIRLTLVTRLEHGQWAARPESDLDVYALLEQVGRVPLPHYIRGGEMIPVDIDRYQTVFAKSPGSVAAPTAGLHFTPGLLGQLTEREIDHTFVTLHVGMGTFRPISSSRLEDHVMHSERGELSEEAARKIHATRQQGGRVIAVGTTSVRVLETAAQATGDRSIQAWTGETELFIRPRYEFRAIDGLLTNFHLPQSTLLVLVRTFGGDELMQRAYQTAIDEEYRFFSYGDAMLVL